MFLLGFALVLGLRIRVRVRVRVRMLNIFLKRWVLTYKARGGEALNHHVSYDKFKGTLEMHFIANYATLKALLME